MAQVGDASGSGLIDEGKLKATVTTFGAPLTAEEASDLVVRVRVYLPQCSRMGAAV
eukprot:COSAG05_NODE_2794_length_2629_cov_10.743402_4_plen_56_part_00